MYEWAQRVWKRQFATRVADIPDPESTAAAELDTFRAAFAEAGMRPPSVRFTKNWLHCRKATSLNAEYLSNSHEVRVCLGLVKSPEDLRGAVARELTWLHLTHKGVPPSDAAVARAVVASCQAELSRVPDLDSETQSEGVRVCSQIYLKRKLPNRHARQVDAWHFYTRQLVDENMFVS